MAKKQPKTKTMLTMFGPAKYDYLRDMISLRTPATARSSVTELLREFRGATTKDKKLRIARATQLAANRAKVGAGNKNLSPRERGQYSDIAGIYKQAAKKMFRDYARIG